MGFNSGFKGLNCIQQVDKNRGTEYSLSTGQETSQILWNTTVINSS